MYMYIGDVLLFCSVHVVKPRCVIHVCLDMKGEEGENGWWVEVQVLPTLLMCIVHIIYVEFLGGGGEGGQTGHFNY